MITGPFLFPSSLYICLHVREREFPLIFVTFIIVIIAFILITHLLSMLSVILVYLTSRRHHVILQDVWPIGGVCAARAAVQKGSGQRESGVCVCFFHV